MGWQRRNISCPIQTTNIRIYTFIHDITTDTIYGHYDHICKNNIIVSLYYLTIMIVDKNSKQCYKRKFFLIRFIRINILTCIEYNINKYNVK